MTLHDLIVHNREQLLRRIRSSQPGEIIDLEEHPIAVRAKFKVLRPSTAAALANLAPRTPAGEPLLTLPGMASRPRGCGHYTTDVTLGRDPDERSSLKHHLFDCGYELDLSSTIHGVQGDTITGTVVADWNKPCIPISSKVFNLASVYVSATRTQTSADFRLLPFNAANRGRQHLLEMRYDPNYVIYLSSYDQSGIFQEDLLRAARARSEAQASSLMPPPATRPITASGRRLRDRNTNPAISSLPHGLQLIGRGVLASSHPHRLFAPVLRLPQVRTMRQSFDSLDI